MINNLLKISALIITGKFLKHRYKGLITLIVFWLIVSFLHDEYISYVELSGNTDYLLQSSIIKISLYLLAFTLYLFFVERKLLISSPKIKPTSNTDNTSSIEQFPAEDSDGFDFLRKKKKLENSADKLLK